MDQDLSLSLAYCVLAEEGQSSIFSNISKLKQLTKHNSFAFALGFLVIGVGVVLWSLLVWFSAPDFRSEGEVVQAKVIRVWTEVTRASTGTDRYLQHLVAYNIMIPTGSELAGSGEVTKEAFDKLQPGDLIKVEILRADPSINRLVDSPNTPEGTFAFTLAGLLFAGLGAFLMRKNFEAATTLSKLHMHGVAATARVRELRRTQFQEGRSAIKIGGQPGDGDPYLYQLIYEYEGSDGQTYLGGSQPYSAVFFAGANPQKNDLIDIIVDPDTPGKSAWCQDLYSFNDKS